MLLIDINIIANCLIVFIVLIGVKGGFLFLNTTFIAASAATATATAASIIITIIIIFIIIITFTAITATITVTITIIIFETYSKSFYRLKLK